MYSLGFVNHRTRTLQEVAELVYEQYDGTVPDSVSVLKEPWRVGDYSARACQIFARGEALALVDTNFARVVGRVLGYEMPGQPHKSDEVYSLLGALVPDDPALARAFNLAILDLGALVCPLSPRTVPGARLTTVVPITSQKSVVTVEELGNGGSGGDVRPGAENGTGGRVGRLIHVV